MIFATDIAASNCQPQRQPCSLLDGISIEVGSRPDYDRLKQYHYRNTGNPPMVTAIYRAVYNEVVAGVIVYARPPLQLKARNAVFGNRYRYSAAATRRLVTGRINREIDRILRVVIHPTFRGIALGQRLVRESMWDRPVRVVESAATMGAINPFFEKAGMTPVQQAHSPLTARIIGVLGAIGASKEEQLNPSALVRYIESLPEDSRAWATREMLDYYSKWTTSRTARDATNVTLIAACRRVASDVLMTPIYYWWQRPAAS